MKNYILQHGQPVIEPDVIKWAQWFGNSANERVIQQTKTGDHRVSTVFIGLDHQFGEGPPLLYETLVLGSGPLAGMMDRYSTEIEARTGHTEMVARAKQLGAKP